MKAVSSLCLILVIVLTTSCDFIDKYNPFKDNEVQEEEQSYMDVSSFSPQRFYVGGRAPSTPIEVEEEIQLEESSNIANYYTDGGTGSDWHVIIASFKNKDLAERFVQKSNQPGLSIIYAPEVNSNRIVHSSYPSVNTAKTELYQQRGTYSDAWLVRF